MKLYHCTLVFNIHTYINRKTSFLATKRPSLSQSVGRSVGRSVGWRDKDLDSLHCAGDREIHLSGDRPVGRSVSRLDIMIVLAGWSVGRPVGSWFMVRSMG